MEVVLGIIGAIPVIGFIGKAIANLFSGDKEKINKELNEKIQDLNEQNNQYIRMNQRNQEKIANLEELLKNNIEEQKRKELERERALLQKQQEEREAKMRQIEEDKKAIQKCKEALNEQFDKGIFEIIKNFSQEEDKWIDSLASPEIGNKINKLKDNLDILFDKLFELENINKNINDKFLEIVKSNVNHLELEKMNFIIIGTSGVGKSTLINELFGEKLAAEGNGKRTTTENKKYESKLVPFMSILDTVGTEIGTGHKLSDVLKETLEEIMNKLEKNNPNEHIHCIIYCTSSNRFFEDELDVILKIREKYDGNKLPIVIAYTMDTNEDDENSVRKAIDEFLKKHDESLSDDIFGISFIPVLSKEKIIKVMGNILNYPCHGLNDLMKACFLKGKNSYRFAIKNSLIQIGKSSIKEYLDSIQPQLANNINYFNYLNNQFEPNFPEYIAFCFQKITDIFKQEGIKEKDLDKLDNYLNKYQINSNIDLSVIKCMICDNVPKDPYECQICNSEVCEACLLNKKENGGYYQCKNCEQDIFIKKENNNKGDTNKMNSENISSYSSYGLNEDFGKKNLSKNFCLICKNNPKSPYKCINCEYEICEECFLKQFEYVEKYICGNCGKDDFEKIDDENKINEIEDEKNDYIGKEEKEKSEKNNIIEDNKTYENKYSEEEYKNECEENENCLQVLENNLNFESKEEIKKYIETFKNELIEVINQRFDEFAQKSANEIYLKISEKYIDLNSKNEKMEKMKDKEQIKFEAIEILNKVLKEKAMKNFLSKIASQFYQEVISKFGSKCEGKLNIFINEIIKNEEANEFFKNCDDLNGNKKLKFEKELNEYLEKLKQKEFESCKRCLEKQGESNENIGSSSSDQNISSSS